jgi:hypothetical protein
MTIEIHKPELERMVKEEIASGHFQNVDDLLMQALQALRARDGDDASGEIGRPSDSRQLIEIFSNPDPIWEPEDHSDVDDAGEWVRQMRRESDRRLNRSN